MPIALLKADPAAHDLAGSCEQSDICYSKISGISYQHYPMVMRCSICLQQRIILTLIFIYKRERLQRLQPLLLAFSYPEGLV